MTFDLMARLRRLLEGRIGAGRGIPDGIDLPVLPPAPVLTEAERRSLIVGALQPWLRAFGPRPSLGDLPTHEDRVRAWPLLFDHPYRGEDPMFRTDPQRKLNFERVAFASACLRKGLVDLTIELHRANTRDFGRDRWGATTTIMHGLVAAAGPAPEAQVILRRLHEIVDARCGSAGQANYLAGKAQAIEAELDALRARGGPHEALIDLLLEAYRRIGKRGASALGAEDDQTLTGALERYRSATAPR
jgi:hypothetical protein